MQLLWIRDGEAGAIAILACVMERRRKIVAAISGGGRKILTGQGSRFDNFERKENFGCGAGFFLVKFLNTRP